MRTWSATILAIFVLGCFTYVTFIKENPVSPWWWLLGFMFFTQIILHDAVEDYKDEDADENEEDSGNSETK